MVVMQFGIYVVIFVFDGVKEYDVFDMMEEVGMQCNGKIVLYDGCMGEEFECEVIVGVMYMIKLVYMVDDKIYVCFIGFYLFVM